MSLILPPYDIRGQDAHGAGYYKAPRRNKKHHGIDIVCKKGDIACSVGNGKVTKIGYPYNQGNPKPNWSQKKKDKFNKKKALRYVQVTDIAGYNVRYFYCLPFSVKVGDTVIEGQAIAEVQGLSEIYPGITEHFHFEVKHGKEYFNPLDYLDSLEE